MPLPHPQSHPPTLPTPRAFLSSLLNNLPHPTPIPNAATTTTKPLPPTSKSPLLTLHALFPTLLLPALDLLDRRLLTRFVAKEPLNAKNGEATANQDPDNDPPTAKERIRITYYALSSSSSSHSRHSRRHHDPLTSSTHYEIRPHAWSCTCPAFAFAAYNTTFSPPDPVTYGEAEVWDDGITDSGNTNNHEDDEMLDVPEAESTGDDGYEWWGGLMRGGEEVPLCKHLLASLLAERWEVAGEMVEERVVGKEEMSGWAAGWGG